MRQTCCGYYRYCLYALVVLVVAAFHMQGRAATDTAHKHTHNVRAELISYMSMLQHLHARFTQSIGKEVSDGELTIDKPSGFVLIEYYTPKRVTISYDRRHTDLISYYDHRLKRKKQLKTQVVALGLLTEPDIKKAITIKDIQMTGSVITAYVVYKGEEIKMVFSKSPYKLRSIHFKAKTHGRDDNVSITLETR